MKGKKRHKFLVNSEMFLSKLVVCLWCSWIMQLNLFFLCVFVHFYFILQENLVSLLTDYSKDVTWLSPYLADGIT